MKRHEYFVYILTNFNKTTLYIGMTNDLVRRLFEHSENYNPDGFTAKYKCNFLIHWESYQYVRDAISREKEIKKWRREKKNNLINELNPGWRFFNEEILGKN